MLRADYPAGRHEAHWDGLDDAGRRPGAGIYLLRLRALGPKGQLHERSHKVQLLR